MRVHRVSAIAIGALATVLIGLPAVPTAASTPATYFAATSSGGAADCSSPFDPCSLPTAINNANANPGSTVELEDGTFSGSLPEITASTTLLPFEGTHPTINTGNTNITAVGFDSVGGTLQVTGLTFTGNGHGISVDHGDVIVHNSVFGNNNFTGVTVNGGTATVTDSSFTGANYGVAATGGNAVVDSSTFDGAESGVISGTGSSVSIRSSTLTGGTNGVALNGGSVAIGGSIVAGNTSDCSGGLVTDDGGNIDGSGSCGFSPANGSVSHSLTITGSLAPLGNYGGPTQTLALRAGSPAIGLVAASVIVAGTPACTGDDQRGLPQPAASCDAGAYQTQPTLYAAPGGNGDCTAHTPATNECALTTAVNEVAPGGTVMLDGGTYTGNDAALSVALPLTLAVDAGASAALSASSGNTAITVTAGAALTVTGLMLQGPSDSYGIDDDAGGTLTVSDSTLDGFGLGVEEESAPVSVVDSTFTNNGYAVFEQDPDSDTAIFDSTLTENNFGIAQLGGSLTLGGDIVAGNNATGDGSDCGTGGGPLDVTDAGGNIDGDGSCGLSAANGSVSGSATIAGSLEQLGNYGGPTATVALTADSPAIGLVSVDLGPSVGCSTPDQRGVARPAGSCDAGAFQTAPPTIEAQVSSATPLLHGWYRHPVTVSFTCTPGGQPLDGACPSPVTLTTSGAAQSVTRNISGADGESDSVTAGPFNIDRDPPVVQISGAKAGRVYDAPAPANVSCHATDVLSGLAGKCTLTTHRSATKVSMTATATDVAGNTTTSHLNYQQLDFYVAHAKYAHGRFTVRSGHAYTVIAYLPSGSHAPKYLSAARGGKPGAPQVMTLAGSNLWTIRTTIAPKTGHSGKWTAAIKVGRRTNPLKLSVI